MSDYCHREEALRSMGASRNERHSAEYFDSFYGRYIPNCPYDICACALRMAELTAMRLEK
jgi:hypothetical protein